MLRPPYLRFAAFTRSFALDLAFDFAFAFGVDFAFAFAFAVVFTSAARAAATAGEQDGRGGGGFATAAPIGAGALSAARLGAGAAGAAAMGAGFGGMGMCAEPAALLAAPWDFVCLRRPAEGLLKKRRRWPPVRKDSIGGPWRASLYFRCFPLRKKRGKDLGTKEE